MGDPGLQREPRAPNQPVAEASTLQARPAVDRSGLGRKLDLTTTVSSLAGRERTLGSVRPPLLPPGQFHAQLDFYTGIFPTRRHNGTTKGLRHGPIRVIEFRSGEVS